MKDLGDRIRVRRKELGLTMRELASRAGCSPSFLCDVERNKRRLGADLLLAIGKALGMPLDELMSNSREPYRRDDVALNVTLPGSLLRFGMDANIPFRDVMTLYWLVRVIDNYRTQDRKVDFEAWDWVRFHEALKEFLGTT